VERERSARHRGPGVDGGDRRVARRGPGGVDGRLLCPFHNRLRNTHPWPERPQPPQADNHAKTDPLLTNEPGTNEPGTNEADDEADPDAKTDPVFTNEPADDEPDDEADDG
jgi:hypothetical protein